MDTIIEQLLFLRLLNLFNRDEIFVNYSIVDLIIDRNIGSGCMEL